MTALYQPFCPKQGLKFPLTERIRHADRELTDDPCKHKRKLLHLLYDLVFSRSSSHETRDGATNVGRFDLQTGELRRGGPPFLFAAVRDRGAAITRHSPRRQIGSISTSTSCRTDMSEYATRSSRSLRVSNRSDDGCGQYDGAAPSDDP